ncbi:MAG: hypothetical protein HC778_04285 [Chamaesiphon sp. CSU_1_12]|nr:hypothetical protein [Chamaesiphon sp. CSU_1_12]
MARTGEFRAGFSAIILGNDNRGIEIGFRKQNTQVAGLTPDIFLKTIVISTVLANKIIRSVQSSTI